MSVEQRVRQRIAELAQSGEHLQLGTKHSQVHNEQHAAQCSGWIAATENAVALACPFATDRYRLTVERLSSSDMTKGYAINRVVGQLTAVLNELLSDIDAGLISSAIDQARAETLDDLLDVALFYFAEKRKDGSGILGTAVFEDTLRRVARKTGLNDKGVKTDVLITQMTQAGTITPIMAKRCRAAAGVRNSALHGQWDELSLDDAHAVISLTRELLSTHLS